MEQLERKCYCTDKNGNLTPMTTNVYENNDISQQVTQETENPPTTESINDTGSGAVSNKYMNWIDKVKSNPTEYFKHKMNKVNADTDKYMKQVYSYTQKALANPHIQKFLQKQMFRPKGGKSSRKTHVTRRKSKRKTRKSKRKQTK